MQQEGTYEVIKKVKLLDSTSQDNKETGLLKGIYQIELSF